MKIIFITFHTAARNIHPHSCIQSIQHFQIYGMSHLFGDSSVHNKINIFDLKKEIDQHTKTEKIFINPKQDKAQSSNHIINSFEIE